MRNAKTLAIVVALGLGLIFSSAFVAQAKGAPKEKESQAGGLPALEDRVETLEAAVAADHALILELETDVIELDALATRTFLFNADPELSSSTTITVATLPVTVGDVDGLSHRLVINYSSVGAIEPTGAIAASPKATLFIGCFVDGIPCVGSQNNPGGVPAGYVNVLSCNFTVPNTCAQWDNGVDHVWYTATKLSAGAHTVVIKAAVGNALVPADPFIGNPGTLFDEARNLVVTVLGSND